MHPTIRRMQAIITNRDSAAIGSILAENIEFLPPTYWKTWTGRETVSLILGHVFTVLTDFRYRRVLGDDLDWSLEFLCKINDLDAVGVDLITLDSQGLIVRFEVVMRPQKSVAALRKAMNAHVLADPNILHHQ
ncbi:MAG: nuclear transport factor 2 family protein [Alphaproteobacteria bacterium]|nr:nuclear transport factor 2 family protein [Alphaproteobacteria bacterium]